MEERMTTRTIALATLLVSLASAPVSAQYDPEAQYCEFVAEHSWSQAYDATAPIEYGTLIVRWYIDEGYDDGDVTLYEWWTAGMTPTKYSELDTSIGPAPRIERDLSRSSA